MFFVFYKKIEFFTVTCKLTPHGKRFDITILEHARLLEKLQISQFDRIQKANKAHIAVFEILVHTNIDKK
jgi:hypothetical protein